MSPRGSDPASPTLPAALSPVVVLLGVAAMMTAAPLAVGSLGLRPALLLSELLLLAPALLAALAFGVSPVHGIGLNLPRPRSLLLSALAGVTLWGTSLGVFEVQYVFWRPASGFLEAFQRLHEALRPAGPADALVSVLAIAVGPAVCEELVFRGIVLPSFVRPLGPAGAAFVSALLFGLIHLDFTPGLSVYRVPFAVVVGVALAAMRLLTGSLATSILAHATLNTITLTVAPLGEDAGPPEAWPLPAGLALLLGGVLLSGLLIRLSRAGGEASR